MSLRFDYLFVILYRIQRTESPMPLNVLLPCDELGSAYLAGQSTTALARRYGCSPTTIAKNLRACGITLRPSRFASVSVDEGTLRRAYLDERWPIAAIAAY